MTDFYNPYNFIPVTGKPTGLLKYDDIKTKHNDHCRHDVWAKGSQSGRIVCRLTLETPAVVGAKQTGSENAQKTVEPYMRDEKPAIPGSSLRGMIGNIAEILSQSALRVLDNKLLKVTIRDGKNKSTKILGNVHDYFKQIDQNTLPWPSGREQLTPAECLFGVVEDKDYGGSQEGTKNLASRLRFSDALPLPGRTVEFEKAIFPLKILDSPKPPCPTMYFHLRKEPNPVKRTYIEKRKLSSDQHAPNGRKVYLHHQQKDIDSECWKSKNHNTKHDHQKLLVTPIKQQDSNGNDAAFFFHIDFDNLSCAELTLLIFSIRPPRFRHHLGLGKSIGLGRVLLKIEGLFLIDRQSRYGRLALAQPRYHFVWRFDQLEAYPELANAYSTEAKCLLSNVAQFGPPENLPFFDRQKTLIDATTLNLLRAAGDPANLAPDIPVHTPLTEHQYKTGMTEDETFRWFVNNDQKGHVALPPIHPIPANKPSQPKLYLPVLKRN